MPTSDQYLAASFHEARVADLPAKYMLSCTEVAGNACEFYMATLGSILLYQTVQVHNENSKNPTTKGV